MFDFDFSYKDKSIVPAANVTKVTYRICGIDTAVEGNDILTHEFPLTANLHLYGENTSYTISHDGLVRIRVIRSGS